MLEVSQEQLSKIKKRTPYIYVLKLEDEHYYVGKTPDLLSQIRFYQRGSGNAWVKAYEPQSLVYFEEGFSGKVSNALVVEYMLRYGPTNVRGGSFGGIDLVNYPVAVKHLLEGTDKSKSANLEVEISRLETKRNRLDRKIEKMKAILEKRNDTK